MPDTINEYLNCVRHYHDARHKEALARATAIQEGREQQVSCIYRQTTDFFVNGYACLSPSRHMGRESHDGEFALFESTHPTYSDLFKGDFSWSVFFRKIAKANKRPLITLDTHYIYNSYPSRTSTNNNYDWVKVSIPRRKYLMPVVLPFLLLPDAELRTTWNARPRSPNGSDAFKHITNSWTNFYFATESPMNGSMWEWVDSFKTDPAKRVALRLDQPISWD